MIEVDKRFYHEDNYYNNDIYGEYREDIKQYINEYKTCEYDKIIEKDKRTNIVSIFSEMRANVIKWYPFEENKKILEIGANYGEITEELARKNLNITAIETSNEKIECLQKRLEHVANLRLILCTNLKELELEEKYEVSVFPLNCEQLRKEDVYTVLKGILYEFPVVKMNFFLPKWVEMLEMSHPIKENVVANAGKMLSEVTLIKDLMDYKMAPEGDYISNMMMQAVNLENGTADIRLDIADQYYYENISELTGTEVTGEYQLISMIKELSEKRKEYEKVADAVQSVEMKGYGVVSPKLSDIKMDDPVLIKHGNKFGVKIKAVAPSVHMIRANIETEIAPIVGSEEQANDLIHYIKEGQSTEDGVWGTSIFGKSIGELMEDGIRSKISMMDDESQMKLQDTMQKVVNDNNGGLVCIII